ncbi:hypothetical protein SAMN04487943_101272 [Gracilibacillus orientalis]|uniref:Yip1 domain-containing protein n=1 Tax=Gracilibacillus orientalis TaxID=334253 RepID=A0A1I4H7K0_9BACI|nr:hypothetical protein [Gracilibacillus orientalis]SFL38248.1 hypothetical protein SAMN04487943_101272 [Gracilibacillus orientalis]
MNWKDEIQIARKMVAASISGSIYAIILTIFVPTPLGGNIQTVGDYVEALIGIVPIYLMYSFPIILVYGTITSIISDIVASLIAKYTREHFKLYFSFVLHILFGLILLWYSLLVAVLFFIVDYVLRKKNINQWNVAIKSLGIPILVWIVFMGLENIIELFK